MKGRGALLGPEKSGRVSVGDVDWFFWVTATLDWFWCGGWLGPALTKLLVGSLDGCVVSLDGVLDHVCGGFGAGVPARILRTV